MADLNRAVLLFPGQGSQYVGMGRSFFEASGAVARLFEEAADVTGIDFKQLCFEGPDATLFQTDNVQPAITLVNMAAFTMLREEGVVAAAVAGHSLGEFAALYAAGVFSFADTMRLVKVRGAAMRAAADRHPGGMLAVFGIDVDTAGAICAEVQQGGAGSVEVANQNSPQQIALTGAAEALKAAGQLAKQRGARLLVPLKVSGPWHSRFMAEARAPMQEALEQVSVAPPTVPVIANITAEPYPPDAAAVRAMLLDQIVRPVLWARSIRRLLDDGYQTFVEAGPGKVLTGLMRDIARDAAAFNVQDVETLQKLRAAGSGPAS
jgi:[acyl-carrier-protein] S-malonyltransferase